jgi:hypothetical protein
MGYEYRVKYDEGWFILPGIYSPFLKLLYGRFSLCQVSQPLLKLCFSRVSGRFTLFYMYPLVEKCILISLMSYNCPISPMFSSNNLASVPPIELVDPSPNPICSIKTRAPILKEYSLRQQLGDLVLSPLTNWASRRPLSCSLPGYLAQSRLVERQRKLIQAIVLLDLEVLLQPQSQFLFSSHSLVV